MSPSIILPTRSSFKCSVLSEGYPSVINYKQVPHLSLSIYIKGNLEEGSSKRKNAKRTRQRNMHEVSALNVK